jgi:hypothetical protein
MSNIIAYKHPTTEHLCYIYPKPEDDINELAKQLVPEGTHYWFVKTPQTVQDPSDPIRAMMPTNLFSRTVEGQMGYFGNVWIRQNYIPHAGMFTQGHKHHFDHVSLLVCGTALVEVDGFEPKEFTGPTFIMIKKEYSHKFTAVTDNVLWYCVFALRDIDGEVTDIYDGSTWPYGSASSGNMINLLNKTQEDTPPE